VTANGYTGNPPGSGGEGGSTAWTDITGKPTTFPPSAHTHAQSDVTGLTAALAGKQPAGSYAAATHAHAQSDVTGLTAALDAKAPLASPALSGTPTAPTATAGTNSTQIATTAFVTTAVSAVGGGGGSSPTFARAMVTSGDITATADASWTPVSGLTLALPAVAGDSVTLSLSCLLDVGSAASEFYDLGVLVGGSIVRAASTGTSTPAAEGDPSLYPSTNVRFRGTTAVWDFDVASGDLSGGNVTFALLHKGAGTGKVFASAAYPLRWSARNDH
jgi:hypothetical protein